MLKHYDRIVMFDTFDGTHEKHCVRNSRSREIMRILVLVLFASQSLILHQVQAVRCIIYLDYLSEGNWSSTDNVRSKIRAPCLYLNKAIVHENTIILLLQTAFSESPTFRIVYFLSPFLSGVPTTYWNHIIYSPVGSKGGIIRFPGTFWL